MGSRGYYQITSCVPNDDVKTKFRYVKGWQDPSTVKKPPAKVARILSQDYNEIKRQCLEKQALWEDPNFPADRSSLFPTSDDSTRFEWKRPGKICENPKMFVEGFERFDVAQGDLGNCWVLAAAASLCCTKNKKMFNHVIPEDNLFVKDYAGVFHFRIWQYGRWIEVPIDDRLPTLNGKLVFVHSTTSNEFWSALLEKAYAKVNGSYEAMQGGSIAEAMEDFTGGVVETHKLRIHIPDNLFSIMKQSFDRDSLLGCDIDPRVVAGDIDGKLPNGLITGHAYSITGLRQCNVRGNEVNLVRVRNPWGNEKEWKGSWSDGSPEWKQLSEDEKKDIDLSFEDDGEFWMSFKDFVSQFTTLDICMAAPLHDEPGHDGKSRVKRNWEMTSFEGSWRKNISAGGCRNHLDTFATNPQYRIEVVDPDEFDEDKTGTIVIALMQKERRKIVAEEGQQMLTIGYYIYKLPPNHTGVLDVNFFNFNRSTDKSPSFCNVREMVGRHKLEPGSYVIIPVTFKPNLNGDFLIRVFSEKGAKITEIDEDTSYTEEPNAKVKKDMPVYGEMKERGSQELKGSVPAESEIKRTKTLLLSETDATEEKDIKALFKEISGIDLEVDAYELRDILDVKFKPEFKFKGFCIETARSMVAMMDIDHSGKLGYSEFSKLWKDIRLWKKVFVQYNKHDVSSLNTFEMRSALNSAGFLVSNHTLKCLAMRYSDKHGLMFFDDFVHCAVRLKTMFALYDEICKLSRGPAIMTLDEFIQVTMYS